MLLLIMNHFEVSAKLVNVKTGFLCEDLKEDTYMEFLQGINNFGMAPLF